MCEKPGYESILAAEYTVQHIRNLARSLRPFGMETYLASSLEQVVDRLRYHCFHQAIVAVEFEVGGELLLARLARLPAMERLIAVGPPDNWPLEAAARTAGAKAYLSRPVTVESLLLTFRALGFLTRVSGVDAAHLRKTVRGEAFDRYADGPGQAEQSGPG
jgi:ActR/RegA family two-component response regulator